jgi:hypothetical protein
MGPTPSPVKAWSVAHIQLDAKLRAYFPMQTVYDWRAYSHLITLTLDIVYNQYEQGSPPTPRGAAPITQLKTFNAAGNTLAAVASNRSEFGFDYADLRNAYPRLRSHNLFKSRRTETPWRSRVTTSSLRASYSSSKPASHAKS